jgi:DNA-binding beta-propeller fold protein YncE
MRVQVLATAISAILLTGCMTNTVKTESTTVVNPDIGGGKILLYSTDGKFLDAANVGNLPDMVRFIDDQQLIVANEGEPADDYSSDPEGSISIIKLAKNKTVSEVTTLGFENTHISNAVRIKPGSTAQQDLEPEYVAVNKAGTKAWVSLQENNAIAIIDLKEKAITSVEDLGAVEWRGQAVDISADGKAKPKKNNPYGIFALYQPDTIASYHVNGQDYLVTANEGDDREYDAWEDYTKAKKLKDKSGNSLLSPYLKSALSENDSQSLRVFSDMGKNKAGIYQQLYMAGTRSFSIRDAQGKLIFDSGSDFEETLATHHAKQFNTRVDDDKSGYFFEGIDARSLKKGAEPEALALANIGNKHFAYIGLEKQGGIFVYDITNPSNAYQVQYFNDIDYSKAPEKAGDLEPEGMVTFQQAGKHLLAVANEMSSSVSLYQLANSGHLNKLSSITLGSFDKGAAEIIAYSPEEQALYVTNGEKKRIDILDVNRSMELSIKGHIDFSQYADDLQSVSVKNGVVAIAVGRRD